MNAQSYKKEFVPSSVVQNNPRYERGITEWRFKRLMGRFIGSVENDNENLEIESEELSKYKLVSFDKES
jgi:hypothetical protein